MIEDTAVRPREDVLYVERIGSWEEYNHEEGGLIVVEDRPELEVGRVISVGDGKDQGKFPCAVSAGDKVVFGRYAGTEFTPTRLFLREAEVHAIVQD